jgi:hypothetical protein
LNVIFSIIGEIYSHTQIWQLSKNEIEMRLYGRRNDDFSDLYHYISFIRSILEYVAPTIIISNVLVVIWCSEIIQMTDKMTNMLYLDANQTIMEEIRYISLVYYVVEFLSEALCWAINRLTSYERNQLLGI